MKSVAGIFVEREAAARACRELHVSGVDGRNIVLLSPDASVQEIASVPTEDAEQPGMGKAVGGVVGGAMGLSSGAIIGSLLLPGIGPVLAVTFGAAAVGIGGAIAGAAAGGVFEDMLTRGVPKDEIFFYEDALRKGHTVVVALAGDNGRIDSARETMRRCGAESVDAARESWWLGIRDAEEMQYPDREHFQQDEDIFRQGYTAALEPDVRGRSFEEASAYLKKNYPVCYEEISFRRGFERGRVYYEVQIKQLRKTE